MDAGNTNSKNGPMKRKINPVRFSFDRLKPIIVFLESPFFAKRRRARRTYFESYFNS
jgi:hypothetical protein